MMLKTAGLITILILGGCSKNNMSNKTEETPSEVKQSAQLKTAGKYEHLKSLYYIDTNANKYECQMIKDSHLKTFEEKKVECTTLADIGQPDVYSCTNENLEYWVYPIYDACKNGIEMVKTLNELN